MFAETTILRASARRHYWSGVGDLSIKCFFGGQAHYDVGGGAYVIDATSYLILNQDQPYTITIDAAKPVESFCVFFARGLAEDAHRVVSVHDAALLDAPHPAQYVSPPFFERRYPHDALVSPLLRQMYATCVIGEPDSFWLAEHAHDLLRRMLARNQLTQREAQALPYARRATREEVYRRVYRARDYADAMFHTSLSLEELAGVAIMSPSHFLRSFRRVFHQTPHQYVTRLRMERARRLLRETDCSITNICLAVGYESLGSFSWQFRQQVGCSPLEYRRQGGTGKARHAKRDDF